MNLVGPPSPVLFSSVSFPTEVSAIANYIYLHFRLDLLLLLSLPLYFLSRIKDDSLSSSIRIAPYLICLILSAIILAYIVAASSS